MWQGRLTTSGLFTTLFEDRRIPDIVRAKALPQGSLERSSRNINPWKSEWESASAGLMRRCIHQLPVGPNPPPIQKGADPDRRYHSVSGPIQGCVDVLRLDAGGLPGSAWGSTCPERTQGAHLILPAALMTALPGHPRRSVLFMFASDRAAGWKVTQNTCLAKRCVVARNARWPTTRTLDGRCSEDANRHHHANEQQYNT